MRRIFLIATLFLIAAIPVAGEEGNDSFDKSTLLTTNKPFNREMMKDTEYRNDKSGFVLLDPEKFSMTQSYSTSMTYSGGESYSYGLYLNTLTYRLFKPLTFSIDLGIYTPFHSTVNTYSSSTQKLGEFGSLVIPRISLDYRPTKNTLISIHYFNLNDASKAYGPFGHLRSPFRY
jgi:hypothetical protein